ncbi:MAG: hypothetical protein M1457_01130 [bacterium]|nr:hypothetical protein [bacterium]
MPGRPLDQVTAAARARLCAAGVPADRLEDPEFATFVGLAHARTRTMPELARRLKSLLSAAPFIYPPREAARLFDEAAAGRLERLETELALAPDFESPTLSGVIHRIAAESGRPPQSFRSFLSLALAGHADYPSICQLMSALGRATVLARLRDARLWIARRQPNLPGGNAA